DIQQAPKRKMGERGGLLRGGWQKKKELAEGVTTAAVDEIHDAAIDAGALGAKLLGAGGGGFMLVFAEPSAQFAIREALKALIEVSFTVGSQGSRIVIYEPDGI